MPKKSYNIPLDADSMKKLIEANYSISQSLEGINSNLKLLNDSNILLDKNTGLFQQQVSQDHSKIIETLKTMTDKYWWMILVLLGIVLAITGYPELAKILAAR